jgi:hypothetical protein
MSGESQHPTSRKAVALTGLGVLICAAAWIHNQGQHAPAAVQKQVVVVHDTVTKVIQQHSALTSGDKTAIAIVAVVLAFGVLCAIFMRSN